MNCPGVVRAMGGVVKRYCGVSTRETIMPIISTGEWIEVDSPLASTLLHLGLLQQHSAILRVFMPSPLEFDTQL